MCILETISNSEWKMDDVVRGWGKVRMGYGDGRWIGFEIKCVNNLIRRKIDNSFQENGLDEVVGMQGPMLGYIYENSRIRDVFQRDIEKEFNIRRSTATVMLQNLEQKGFLIREAVDYDARLKKIVLTEKAVEHHQRIRERIDIFHRELEKGITSAEKEEFLRILDKIKKNLDT